MKDLTKQFITELYRLPEMSQEFVREETKEKVAELFEHFVQTKLGLGLAILDDSKSKVRYEVQKPFILENEDF